MKDEGTVQKTTIGGLTAYHYGVRPVQPTSPAPVVVASRSGPTGPPLTLAGEHAVQLFDVLPITGGPSGPSRKVPVTKRNWLQRFVAWLQT